MGKSIGINLIEDDCYGPKIVDIGNWSGKAIYAPTPYLPQLLNSRESELNNPGIYFLKSFSSSSFYQEKIYVGEGERIIERLAKHLTDSSKEFNECIAFFSSNRTLTKAHVKYLESRCIRIIKELDNAELENKQKNGPLPSLPEYDVSDMECFLEHVKIILPLVGYNCFKSNFINKQQIRDLKHTFDNSVGNIYYINRTEVNACLIKTENNFIVLKGSTCKRNHNNSVKQGRIDLRKKLIQSHKLKDLGNVYIFEKDVIYNSTSEAASVILGAQTSGPQTWKDATGNTYASNMKDALNNKKCRE